MWSAEEEERRRFGDWFDGRFEDAVTGGEWRGREEADARREGAVWAYLARTGGCS